MGLSIMMAGESVIGNPSKGRVMPTGERKVTLTAGLLVILLFGAPLLGMVSSVINELPEELERESEPRHTHDSTSMNEPGFQAGSIFTGSTITGGLYHTCAILDNKSMKCWGQNEQGQLGLGDYNQRLQPRLVDLGGGRNAVSVSAGYKHTCAILDDASLVCWGRNGGEGALGGGSLGTYYNSSQLVDLGAGRTAVSISAGAYHTCAILDDASLACWGRNGYGQLGIGSNSSQNSPQTVDLGAGRKAVTVSAGEGFTCAILDNSSLKCWGDNQYGQLGIGTGSDDTNHYYTPQLVDLDSNSSAVAVALGSGHACVILDDGSLKCWGQNSHSQVGLGAPFDDVNQDSPQTVLLEVGRSAVALTAGYDNSCAILDNASLACWGDNEYGQLGPSSTVPGYSRIPSPTHVDLGSNSALAVSNAGLHTCVAIDNGSLNCLGYNQYGQLGLGNYTPSGGIDTPQWVNLGTGRHVDLSERDIDGDGTLNIFDTHMPGMQEGSAFSRSTIAAGSDHTCAILVNGSLYCWGENDYGQLGLGDTTLRTLPSYVDLGGGSAIGVAAGYKFTCVIVENGSIYCWGKNHKGQLGNDNFANNQNNPQLVNLSSGRTAVQVATGSNHACAVLDNGSVNCWGWNSEGQLGDGSSEGNGDALCTTGCWSDDSMYGGGQSNPVFTRLDYDASVNPPPYIATAVSVSAGNRGSCAVLDDGRAKCWGTNYFVPSGASENPQTVDNNASDVSSMVTVVSYSSSSCGLLDNGSVYCWGAGGVGQMGVNSTNNHYAAAIVSVQGLGQPVVSISAGWDYFCAILQDRSMKCWGENVVGKLGVGNTTNQHLPVSVNITGDVVSVSAGGGHTCVIMLNSSMKCWGQNGEGQLGQDTGQCEFGYPCSIGNELNEIDALPEIDFGSGVKADPGDADVDGDGFREWFDDYPDDPARGVNCPAGSYGRYVCVEASEGHHAAGGVMYQTECAPGTYQPSAGRPSCIAASAGHYVTSAAATTQVACPAGTYNPLVGQTSSSACLDAESGHYVSSQGMAWQTPCPAGTYNAGTGSSSLTDCVDASPGYYASGVGSLDTTFESSDVYEGIQNWSWLNDTCEQNWHVSDVSPINGNYSLSAGGQHCSNTNSTITFEYYFPVTGSIEFSYRTDTESFWDNLLFCVDLPDPNWGIYCAENSNPNNPNGTIVERVNGTAYFFSGHNNSGSINVTVSPGYHNFSWQFSKDSAWTCGGNNASACEDKVWIDDISIWTGEGASNQTVCAPGTYEPNYGSYACLEAGAGYYVNSTAATSQTACPLGTYQNQTGQASCLDASPGYYVDSTGATNQNACEEGTYNPNSGSTSDADCIDASPGYYVPTAGSANQTAASPGYYVNDTGAISQIPCSPGTYQPSYAQTSCLNASPGYYVDSSASPNQTPCSPGTYQPYNASTSCIDASAGYYVSGSASTNQTACSPGAYQPSTGQTSCIDASAGYYVSGSASTNQTPCSPGTYQSNQGQTSCMESSPGYYVDSYGASNQTSCPGGTYNPNFASTSSTDCLITSAGFYSTNGSATQTPCSPGTYQPSSGQPSCFEASPGHHVPSYSSAIQIPCSPGTYQPHYGMSSCYIADSGFYATSYGLTNQTACEEGTYNPLNGSSSSSDCIDASPGHHAPYQGMSEQYECNPGAYQPAAGQSNCTNADPGYFVSSNASTSQEPCETGTYQPDSGRSSCRQPHSGHYVPSAGSHNQTAADSGYYANAEDNDTTSQHPCLPGSFQSNTGRSHCYSAEPGHYVDYAAATNQTACLVGTYNQLNGSDSIAACVDASPGYYADDTGMLIHLACDYGMYQPSPGQTSCLQAQPGYYVSNNGSALQTPCESGTYNPDSGSVSPSSCISADPGHHVSEEAMASQEPCLPGTYQPDGGTDSCIDAATGYYVESSNATSQTIAAIDHYVDSTGSSVQTQCPSLHITMYEGSVSLEACLVDSDSDRDPDRDDEDDDNDGMLDQNDFCNPGMIGWLSGLVEDSDVDGCRDSDEDLDDDNDGRLDDSDAFPFDPTEQDDTDGDGLGDNSDVDDDNDGLSDAIEYDIGTNPLVVDTDGDGVSDKDDAFPLDVSEWMDTDGDGTGDNSDFMKTMSRYQTQDQLLLDLGLAVLILFVINSIRNRKEGDEDFEDSPLPNVPPGLEMESEEE
uniref:RCC1 domain-containing protein n=1 Tax=uncultured marine group II/III euryarchaeote SAT1000_51_D10 TaxID=1456587 RepID=A0A075ICF3_9EURY|nr:RCC1 domain-containing protein [uncultured marine group II/III euryarchaeote SAT1000_51_D10]